MPVNPTHFPKLESDLAQLFSKHADAESAKADLQANQDFLAERTKLFEDQKSFVAGTSKDTDSAVAAVTGDLTGIGIDPAKIPLLINTFKNAALLAIERAIDNYETSRNARAKFLAKAAETAFIKPEAPQKT